MKSNIEVYIRQHRTELDDQLPSSELWSRIEDQLHPDADRPIKRPRIHFLSTMAAAAALVILAGSVWLYMDSRDVISPTSTKNLAIIEEIDPDYARQVGQYTRLINSKQAELKKIERDQPLLYKEFMQDIQRLDSSYNALKIQLPENPNREQLLEAMITNLQLQTELLNQQLQVIKKIKQSKNSGNENNFKTL